MGDLKLLDILQTLCIGVFCLTLIIFFYFFYSKCFVKTKFNVEEFLTWLKNDILKGKLLETGYLSLAIVMVYFLGILASDLTERMTDSNNAKERNYVLKELNAVSFMPSVGDIRKLALIDSDDSLTTLGNSVFSSLPLIKEANTFNKSSFYYGIADSTSLNKNLDSLTRTYLPNSKFERFISLLYYTSKNWCYSKEHEPLNELKSIQNRIDLSRSVVLLTTVAIQLVVLLFLVFIIINWTSLIKKVENPSNNNDPNIIIKNLFISVRSLFIRSLLIFFVTALLCRECFKICLLSYNKRAYGYYVTHLAKPDIEKSFEKKKTD